MTAQPGFATSSSCRADHAARGIHGGHVDGDVVAAVQDVVEVGDVLNGGR